LSTKTKENQSLEKYDALSLERSSGERWVNMKNALTRAGQGLSLSEKRLVMLAVSKLDSKPKVRIDQLPVTRVTAAEYAELFDLDIDTAYTQLQTTAKALYNRSITIFEPAHKRKGKPITQTRIDMRWVGRCTYHKKEGWVELAWWHELIGYLTGIERQFTSYQLSQASALRSMYSWRLLELLMRFESTGWAEYTIEDFATSMDATPKMRDDFAKIRTKIIEPAVLELIQKDGWIIKWTPIKAGRKVAKVRFEFKRNPQGQLDL